MQGRDSARGEDEKGMCDGPKVLHDGFSGSMIFRKKRGLTPFGRDL